MTCILHWEHHWAWGWLSISNPPLGTPLGLGLTDWVGLALGQVVELGLALQDSHVMTGKIFTAWAA
jgi:hypothetical protein